VDSKVEDSNSGNKESNTTNFGIVTDEDREADRVALEKLTSLIEERLKTNPLPPPPPLAPGDRNGNSNSELPAKSRDGDSDVDITRNGKV
jgi:RNA-binding protein 25